MSPAHKDFSPNAVLLMMGVALGVPMSIVVGLIIDQTGFCLLAGPPAGLVLGLILIALAPKDEGGQPSNP